MQRSYRFDATDQVLASFLLQLKHRPLPQGHCNLDERDTRTPLQEVQSSHLQKVPSSYPKSSSYGLNSFEKPSPERPPALIEEPSIDELTFEELVEDSDLVQMNDRDLVPDALFVAMAQMIPCKLTQADRVGCYKSREIGFLGMCCKHCGGQPGFGRYYPNSVRSLAQTTTSQTILKHIGGKCHACPPSVRNAVLELQREQDIKDAASNGRPRYGSRKIFFQRMWERLHSTSYQDGSESELHGSRSAESTDLDSEEETREDRAMMKKKRKYSSIVHENKRLCIGA